MEAPAPAWAGRQHVSVGCPSLSVGRWAPCWSSSPGCVQGGVGLKSPLRGYETLWAPLDLCWELGLLVPGGSGSEAQGSTRGFGLWAAAAPWGVPPGHPLSRGCESSWAAAITSRGVPVSHSRPARADSVPSRCEMAAGSCLLLVLLPCLATASHSNPGCRIRITAKGLDLGKGLVAGTLRWGEKGAGG